MKCKFSRYEETSNGIILKRYSCEEVRSLRDQWITDFRRINKTDVVERTRKDTAFEIYKKSIDEFIEDCKCNAEG